VVETVWGKVVLIVYCFVGLGILANMIQNVGSAVMSNLSRMKSTKESLALVRRTGGFRDLLLLLLLLQQVDRQCVLT